MRNVLTAPPLRSRVATCIKLVVRAPLALALNIVYLLATGIGWLRYTAVPDKNILHLTGMDSTKYGGLERYFVEFSRVCRERGYKTILQYESLPRSSTYLSDLESSKASVISVSTHVPLPRGTSRIATLLHSTRPEVIQFHFSRTHVLLTATLIARMLGVRKTIVLVHGMSRFRRNSLEAIVRRLAYNHCDHVLGVSNAVVENLIHFGVNPRIVSTHYLGLFGKRNISGPLRLAYRNEFGIPEGALVLACIAFDARVKGLDILLQAFKQVLQAYPQTHLIIVGVDPNKSELPEQANNLGVANSVHWAGIRDEGWRLLNAADLYIQPSRSEALGLAILEAMALRLPVVANRVGAIPELVVNGETGYLADLPTKEHLAATIKSSLATRSKWKILGQAGYNRYWRSFRGDVSIDMLLKRYIQ